MKKSIGAQALVFCSPVWVVGSYGHDGVPDIMAVSWGGICCSQPPCVSIGVQPIRYTYKNLLKRMAFTVSVPPTSHAKEADYVGLVSGKDTDKFAVTGLTPVKSDLVDAPYVLEFPLVLECRVVHQFDLGSHIQFIGEILDVKADTSILGENGLPDMVKVDPIVVGAKSWGYYSLGEYIGQAFSLGRALMDNDEE